MDIKITPNHLHGSVKVPQSKSICHRALICAALADKPTRLLVTDVPDDVRKTAEFVRAIGAEVDFQSDHIAITPVKDLPESASFDCEKSRNTIRFAIPLTASLGIKSEFFGDEKLKIDHISSLMEMLKAHGCTFESQMLPIKMTGKIRTGDYYISASESSQFISSLMMGLARTKGDSKIVLLPPNNSKRYIDVTVSVLQSFGSSIECLPDGYLIHGKPFVSPGEFCPEGDFSAAAVWLSMGVAVTGIDRRSKQADETALDVLVSMGALLFERDGELHCHTNNMHSFCLDAAQFPDILPALCAAAATAKGTTHVMGAGKLKYRDTDRINGICGLINALGGKAYPFAEDIVIEGVPSLKGGEAPCGGDHRLVLAAAALSCNCKEPVIIRGADSVQSNYRNFWNDFRSVGGIYEQI